HAAAGQAVGVAGVVVAAVPTPAGVGGAWGVGGVAGARAVAVVAAARAVAVRVAGGPVAVAGGVSRAVAGTGVAVVVRVGRALGRWAGPPVPAAGRPVGALVAADTITGAVPGPFAAVLAGAPRAGRLGVSGPLRPVTPARAGVVE